MTGKAPVPVMFAIRHMNMGGAQRQLFNLATGLDPHRFRPVVVCLHREEPLMQRLRESGIETLCVPARRSIDPGLPLRLARLARDREVRILHSYLFAANAWGRIAARLAGIPAVASERTDRRRRRRREILAERVLAPLTAAYIVNSAAVARRVLEAVPAMRGRLRMIPNGIDLTPFALDRDRCRADLRALLRLPPDATLAGVLGTLSPDKAHGVLLEALSRLPRTVGLVVVGEGPERRALEDRIRARELEGRVHLLGHRDDVPALLVGLDLLVQSSLREGMPNAVLEGMAATLPVVATAVGGTAEALEDGRCGVLVAPGSAAGLAEAMATLLADPGRAATLATLARERVEREYSLAGMVRRTEALYAEILQL